MSLCHPSVTHLVGVSFKVSAARCIPSLWYQPQGVIVCVNPFWGINFKVSAARCIPSLWYQLQGLCCQVYSISLVSTSRSLLPGVFHLFGINFNVSAARCIPSLWYQLQGLCARCNPSCWRQLQDLCVRVFVLFLFLVLIVSFFSACRVRFHDTASVVTLEAYLRSVYPVHPHFVYKQLATS